MSTDNGQAEPADIRIDPEINTKLHAYQAAANQHRSEIGQMEIKKHQIL